MAGDPEVRAGPQADRCERTPEHNLRWEYQCELENGCLLDRSIREVFAGANELGGERSNPLPVSSRSHGQRLHAR